MVARSDSLDRTVEDTATNCLMLLSRVGECGGGGDAESVSRVFRCKTCMKEFSSFQALRGHRVIHKKAVNNYSSGEEQSGIIVKKESKKTAWHHRCSICGLEFQMGQALGGHMRKHWNKEESGGALATLSLFPEAAMARALKETSEGKGVAYLESGSDWVDGINLKLQLGRTIY